MKKIMVTGGAGFIGSNFVRYQLETYQDVHIVNFDKLTYAGNLENLKGIDESRYTFVRGDIADADTVENALRGCDAVVNFAADTHVDRSILGAAEFIATNVVGVHNLLELGRKLGLQRILLVSTDEVYGSVEHGSSKETDALQPRNPYSASKASGDLLGLSFFTTYGTPVVITRGSNTYGPYQYPEKVMPLFITNAIDDDKLPLYGDGKNIRDWLYVRDHCSGIDCALRKGQPGNVYNVAGGNERENVEVTHKILEVVGKGPELIRHVEDRPGHDRRYSIDSTKLKSLGWKPTTGFDDGFALTANWYKDNEWWWRKIKSGEFRKYYEQQYGDRLRTSE